MTTTKYLQLPIPSKSDRGKIITECLDPAFTKMDQKIESIDSNIDFNLLATLGIPYGGILNNTNAKVAGTAYYDTANKKIYKCTANTSINYADSAYFEEISNNDLLGKLKNLFEIKTEEISNPSGGTVRYSVFGRVLSINYINITTNEVPLNVAHPNWVKQLGSNISFSGGSLTNQWGESAEVLADHLYSYIYNANRTQGSLSGTLVSYIY